MIRRFGTSAASLAILAPALLSGCGPTPNPSLAANPPPAASAPILLPKPAAKPRVFTLDTPVDRIAADPQGKAVLDRDVPGLMSDKRYPMFDDMSLSEIALFSNGRLSKSKLALVQSDLIELSELTPDSESPITPPAQ